MTDPNQSQIGPGTVSMNQVDRGAPTSWTRRRRCYA
jgi:hypothetical protein